MPLFVPQSDLAKLKIRYVWMLILIALAFALLSWRLYFLQVSHGEEYLTLSRDNVISDRRVVALRGMIYDRNYQLMADNRPSFNLYFTAAFCRRPAFEETLNRLTEYLGLSDDEIERTRNYFEKTQGLNRHLPLLVRRDMLWEELAQVEQNQDQLEGIDVRPETRRSYPSKNVAAHLLGYVGEISPEELKDRKDHGYRQGDMIGKAGMESAWEKELRGVNGLTKVVVDARGQRVPEAQAREVLQGDGVVVPTIPGHNLIMSLDLRLQTLAESHFPGREGGVVALNPQTGFILAIASKPAFDPNLVSGRISPRVWRELVLDPDRPLLNRATQQHYPPGSTFKPFTGLAALHSGALTETTPLTCTGALHFGSALFRCWRAGGHGTIQIHTAIVRSCDVFFYRAGLKAGLDAIAEMGHSFGFGSITGFESCREVPGIMPSRAWYEKNTKTGFLPGFTVSDSIGQGDVNVTPLQLALAYGALANGGTLYKPQVVSRIETPTHEVVKQVEPMVRGKVLASPEHLEVVVKALTGVVNEPGGTAYYRRPRNVTWQAAGKTGTAQVVKQGNERGRGLPYDFRDHAWFVGWGPVDNPQIVVAVVNEHGGHGGSGAAPLVMEMITYYLEELQEEPME